MIASGCGPPERSEGTAHEVCGNGWEALRGDPLPWLLDERQPNLHWRVLSELVQRPYASPAVRRARGGANVVEPIDSLLADLHPDGTWATRSKPWSRYSGTGWRLIAALQWGADPDDPRLQAAATVLLETASGEGGIAPGPGKPPSAAISARVIEALSVLGCCRHPRFQECLAWLQDGPDGLGTDNGTASSGSPGRIIASATTAAAAISALQRCGPAMLQRPLYARAVELLLELLRGNQDGDLTVFGHPNLLRTDLSEILAALVHAGCPYDQRMRPALQLLQRLQQDGGRWLIGCLPGSSLPVGSTVLTAGTASPWITLRGVSALLRYAVDAGLPRLFPRRPGS